MRRVNYGLVNCAWADTLCSVESAVSLSMTFPRECESVSRATLAVDRCDAQSAESVAEQAVSDGELSASLQSESLLQDAGDLDEKALGRYCSFIHFISASVNVELRSSR